MEMDKFAEVIREKLVGRIGDVTEISISRVVKNNSVVFKALVFKDERSNVTPTLYLDEYYRQYQKGRDLEEIVEAVIACYQEARIDWKMDVSFMRDWELAKPMVAFKLINKERNKELLEQIPHKDILDLSMVFYLSLNQGEGTILIHNNHCDLWGINAEELIHAAEENTPRICPMRLRTFEDVKRRICGIEVDEEAAEQDTETLEMYILSNESGLLGAAAMLYPGSMNTVAERLQSDFYILPSSLHEVIILPAKKEDESRMLLKMVHEVNETVMQEEEILGDNVYLYSRERQEICLAA